MIRKDCSGLPSELSLPSLEVQSHLSAFRAVGTVIQGAHGLWQMEFQTVLGSQPSRQLAALGAIISHRSRNVCCFPRCQDSFTGTSAWLPGKCSWEFCKGLVGGPASGPFQLSAPGTLLEFLEVLWENERPRKPDNKTSRGPAAYRTVVLQHKGNNMHCLCPWGFYFQRRKQNILKYQLSQQAIYLIRAM